MLLTIYSDHQFEDAFYFSNEDVALVFNKTNSNKGKTFFFADTDGDGVTDDIDVDDDNDGILDTEECVSATKITYSFTGSDQAYTIPVNAVSITAKLWGAGGRGDERSGRGVGGAGGYTEVTIATANLSNNTIILTVGEGGSSSTGAKTYGNGGAGLAATVQSRIRNFGSGGGMSAISYKTLRVPTAVVKADLIAIAGGGASMPAYSNANTNSGEGGGTIGGNATDSRSAINGLGGTQSTGGASTSGNPGSFLSGGNAVVNGSAGGGGYYGGGGGSFAANNEGGGGGGSGYITSFASAGQTIKGNVRTPPKQTDTDYIAGVGVGGNNNGQNGRNGLIVLTVNYQCDVDNDGLINSLDTDSDNDGCADAIEAQGGVQAAQLSTLTGGSNGGSSQNLGNVSDADGNPVFNGAGFEQAITTAVTDANNKNSCLIDLEILKTVNKPIAKINQIVVFTLKLTNMGEADATNITVIDKLPDGLTFNLAGSTIPSNTSYDSTSGIWDLKNTRLPIGNSIQLKIAATLTSVNTIVINKAEVFATLEEDKDSTPSKN